MKDKSSGERYALKILRKDDLRRRNQVLSARWERNLLASVDSPWLVKLFSSFQDRQYLFFLLEYVPGGDLMALLQREDVLTEDAARFYAAEIVAALDVVHSLGYIYRDLKPDNVLIDRAGHLCLTDFGLVTPFDASPMAEAGSEAVPETEALSSSMLANSWRSKRQKVHPQQSAPWHC